MKPDFAASLTRCFFCGEEDQILINTKLTKEAADAVRETDGKVINMIPCPKCEKLMEQGIMLIVIDPDKSPPGWQMKEPPNPYRTGRRYSVTEEAFTRIVNSDIILKHALEYRFIFITEAVEKETGLSDFIGGEE